MPPPNRLCRVCLLMTCIALVSGARSGELPQQQQQSWQLRTVLSFARSASLVLGASLHGDVPDFYVHNALRTLSRNIATTADDIQTSFHHGDPQAVQVSARATQIIRSLAEADAAVTAHDRSGIARAKAMLDDASARPAAARGL
ncbi:hypothetical protein [Paraburkholderia kururiensis]|uniref:hypothetical protein n=1 Tax=Paraburkholderia kururiensis TaxID=984307 RepID=UPI000F894F46|nr:hypothetical protein [Paraburkholderia kururiensis]